jgi:hypothetical protein
MGLIVVSGIELEPLETIDTGLEFRDDDASELASDGKLTRGR